MVGKSTILKMMGTVCSELSHAFLNCEEHHFHFSEYLMPINKLTIKEQVEHMLQPCVWGTHLELKAAATLFQLPIYCCTQQSLQHDVPFTWSVVCQYH